MKLKNTIIKYLLILVSFELVLHVLKLIIPVQVQQIESFEILRIIRAIIFIFLLKDLYKCKIEFVQALLTVIAFPLVLQLIQVCFGNIFINFCPAEVSKPLVPGILGLLNEFKGNNCNYITRFSFFPFLEHPLYCLKMFLVSFEFRYLWDFFLCPLVFYFFLFFKFCLFKVFERNSENPYLSLVPVVNDITLLKICQFPVYWIFALLIPFVRLLPYYKINKRLCEIESVSQSNAIWITLLPYVFFGKLLVKSK